MTTEPKYDPDALGSTPLADMPLRVAQLEAGNHDRGQFVTAAGSLNGAAGARARPGALAATKPWAAVSGSHTVAPVDAATLKKRRADLGLSLTEMARALGVNKMTVYKWEHDTHAIPESVALVLRRLKPADIKQLAKRNKRTRKKGA